MRRFLTLIIVLLFCLPIYAETFVVCVGIADYLDPKVEDLDKTENDAADISSFFRKGTTNVITLCGRNATKNNILAALKLYSDKTQSGDKIIFYFSGHGYPGGFCPYDMTQLSEGLTYGEVVGVLKSSKATERIIFADACNSGAIRHKKKTENPEPGNVMFFLSSRGSERSIESKMMRNGFFTRNLLRGLGGFADIDRNLKITASELFKYVSNGVKHDSRDAQHPVMWGNFDDDMVIVEYKRK